MAVPISASHIVVVVVVGVVPDTDVFHAILVTMMPLSLAIGLGFFHDESK